MYSLREFVKKGLIAAIGVQADYWVMLTAANWFQKGILLNEDMIEIQELIDEKNTPVEPIEEISAENTAEVAEEETTEEVVETNEEPIEEVTESSESTSE